MAGYNPTSTPNTKQPVTHLPTDAAARKKVPLWSGLMKYFPDALVAIAQVSQAGNDQHNPGQPLHWSREKSCDHEDTLLRHLMDSGTVDIDGHRHSAKAAWRALAILQLEIEAERKAQMANECAKEAYHVSMSRFDGASINSLSSALPGAGALSGGMRAWNAES